MSGEQNWRIPAGAEKAEIYFGNQQKQAAMEERRPTIRKAADLVGPGIGAEAVRLDDYNDLLATFNGYFSSDVGALNAPNANEAFVGQVVSDALLGGRQIFAGLTSGIEYSRTFVRSPTDPEAIGWGAWTGQRIPATAVGDTVVSKVVRSGTAEMLSAPRINTIGDSDVYERQDSGIRIRRQGVYTGHVQVGGNSLADVADVSIERPNGLSSLVLTHYTQPVGHIVYYPFTVWASDELQAFSVSLAHTMGTDRPFWWRFQCTRVGDAV